MLKPRKRPLTLRVTYKDGTVCRSSYPTRDPDAPCSSDTATSSRGPSLSRSPVPAEQARAFAVLRRPPTDADRSPAVRSLLRRALISDSFRGVRLDSIRLLRRRPDGLTILVSIQRLGRGPHATRDALCVLSADPNRSAGFTSCGSLGDVLRGRVRWSLPPAGLVPDGVKTARIRVAGAKTIDAPVRDNFYDLTRPEGEQYAGLAPPVLLDEQGREYRPPTARPGG